MTRRLTGRGFKIVGDELAIIFGVSSVRERDTGKWYSNTWGRCSAPTDIMSPMQFPIPGTVVSDERNQVHLVPYDAAILFAQGTLTLAHFQNAVWSEGVIYIPNVVIDGDNVVVRIFRNVNEVSPRRLSAAA